MFGDKLRIDNRKVLFSWCWFANNAQAYIGTAPTPRDVFCVKYVPNATGWTIITVTLVVFFSCLVVVVAAMVIYYRRRRRRPLTTGVAAAAGTYVSNRYSELRSGRRTNDIWGSEHHRKIGGNVRFAPQFYDRNDRGSVRWVNPVSNSTLLRRLEWHIRQKITAVGLLLDDLAWSCTRTCNICVISVLISVSSSATFQLFGSSLYAKIFLATMLLSCSQTPMALFCPYLAIINNAFFTQPILKSFPRL